LRRSAETAKLHPLTEPVWGGVFFTLSAANVRMPVDMILIVRICLLFFINAPRIAEREPFRKLSARKYTTIISHPIVAERKNPACSSQ